MVGPLYSFMPFNISTVHLDNSGMIHDCKCIAESLSQNKKSGAISGPAYDDEGENF